MSQRRIGYNWLQRGEVIDVNWDEDPKFGELELSKQYPYIPEKIRGIRKKKGKKTVIEYADCLAFPINSLRLEAAHDEKIVESLDEPLGYLLILVADIQKEIEDLACRVLTEHPKFDKLVIAPNLVNPPRLRYFADEPLPRNGRIHDQALYLNLYYGWKDTEAYTRVVYGVLYFPVGPDAPIGEITGFDVEDGGGRIYIDEGNGTVADAYAALNKF